MKWFTLLVYMASASRAVAQNNIQPVIVSKTEVDGEVTVVAVRPHFVTSIRMPEPVNSVAVGDPQLFQAEHSEHEPNLVFVKTLATTPAETNLLIQQRTGERRACWSIFCSPVPGRFSNHSEPVSWAAISSKGGNRASETGLGMLAESWAAVSSGVNGSGSIKRVRMISSNWSAPRIGTPSFTYGRNSIGRAIRNVYSPGSSLGNS